MSAQSSAVQKTDSQKAEMQYDDSNSDPAAAQTTHEIRSEAPARPPVRKLREPRERPGDDPHLSRESQGGRLLEARQKAGFRTASDAARVLRIAGPTYLAHENGTRQIRPDMAAFYAREFKVSTNWLLYNQGDMAGERTARPEGGVRGRTASAMRSGVSEEPAGLACLLSALHVSRTADGSFTKLDSVSGRLGKLPLVRDTDGYVPELSEAHGGPSECLVALSDQGERSPLALRDISRVPLDMVEPARARLFCMKLQINTLFRDVQGGQRVYVDPDDTNPAEEGVFIVMGGGILRLHPAYLKQAGGDQLQVIRSLNKRSALFPPTDFQILGRIVLQLRSFGEIDVQAIADAALAPVN